MHSVLQFCAGVALVAASTAAMPMIDHEKKAPHFSEILQPSEPLLLCNTTGDNTTFLLTYRNGERADETLANVALVNDTGSFMIAEGLQFVDNWYTINATVSFPSAQFADGNYSLSVEEVYEGSTESQTTVPLTFSRNANATVSTSTLSSSLAGPTESAYWGNAPQTPDAAVAANVQPESTSLGRLASALAALTQA